MPLTMCHRFNLTCIPIREIIIEYLGTRKHYPENKWHHKTHTTQKKINMYCENGGGGEISSHKKLDFTYSETCLLLSLSSIWRHLR